jgi:mono/diheme cytochrome c family protein
MALPLIALALPASGMLTAAAPVKKAPARAAKPAAVKPAADTFRKDVAPVLQKYCVGCHGGNSPAAGVTLATYKDTASVIKERSLWEKAGRNVSSGHMPPKAMPQPTKAERDRFVAWVESTLSKANCDVKDPGRVTMRRLNREEYNNTIRDLFGVLNLRPADAFPSDDVGYGFDNIGDVLSLSPLLMEKYLNAAEKITQAVIIAPENRTSPTHIEAESLPDTEGSSFESGRMLASAGEVGAEHDFSRAGEYVLRAQLFAQQAGSEPAKVAFRLDGKDVYTVDVKATEGSTESYETRVQVPEGKHRFAVAFLNDYYQPDAADPKDRDRNLVVDYLEVEGPLGWQGPLPLSHQRIMIADPKKVGRDEAARKIMSAFARRAFRRPVTSDEVERLVRYVGLAEQQGESFERGIQLAVQAALCSPHFLFRVEVDRDPNNPTAKHPVGQYEMASRLSYFLWSSMPDEKLFQLATQGKLQDPKVLEAQVRRMLMDSRAKALADNFGGQWLTLRRLANVAPARRLFPQWNNDLRQAMRTETELFFREIVKQDRSILDFLDGRFTYLNEPLAKLYGIEGIKGDKFQRVVLADSTNRRGIITQASILTLTSNPTRTSPVKRGKWVMEQLLGTSPPPPPPGTPELPDDRQNRRRKLEGTLRQRFEQHRKDPMCHSCHARMDPIGFGLENFDAIGGWRTKDGDSPVDSSGELSGRRFSGPLQLIQILKGDKDEFERCLTEKMLTYALGRGLEPYDNCNVDAAAKRIAGKGHRFSALVSEVVMSEPFRMRRGDGGRS